jgi:RNA polymerase subunit RPABC4/transcription elongation factor Spt4
MTSCRACGRMIADDANTCPHCGASFKSSSPVAIGLVIMLLISVLYVLSQRYL